MANKKQKNTVNWFGTSRNPTSKLKIVNKPFSFLGLGTTKSNKIPSKVKFFDTKSSSLFIKETTKSKRLSKWGDVDLDGTPNYFDCDPRNWLKDSPTTIFTQNRTKKINKSGDYTIIANNLKKKQNKIKKEKNYDIPYEDSAQKIIDEASTGPSKKEQKEILREAKEKMQQLKAEKSTERRKKIRRLIEPLRRGYKKATGQWGPYEQTKFEVEKAIKSTKFTPEEKEALITEQSTITEKQTKAQELKNLLKDTSLGGQLKARRYAIDTKIAQGKIPTRKELEALAKAEQKVKKIGTIREEGRISRELLKAAPGGGVARALTGAGVGKTGEWEGELKARSRRIQAMTKKAVEGVFGPSLFQTRFDSEPRSRGRPPGPSGEYKIGGRPVYEEAYQQYAAKQNALNRMLPSTQQSAELNPEYVAYMQAQQEQQGTPQTEAAPFMDKEGMLPEAPNGEQQMLDHESGYTRASPDEIKIAQYRAQQLDNPLNAPNFMKGQLRNAGGSILTPIGPNILDAPQIFKGEMRNIIKRNLMEEGEVKLGERPQGNPMGSEFLEIELGSGKPVIRKRISEKWMSGEAL